MQLTQFTDYGLRVILFVGLKGDRASVSEIADAFHISRNHLVKVVHKLAIYGLIKTIKGKGGGIELDPSCHSKTLGEIVRLLEPNMELVECFNEDHNTCPIIGVCKIETLMHRARSAFYRELDKITVSSLIRDNGSYERQKRLGLRPLIAPRSRAM